MDDLISRQALYGEFNKLSKPFDGSDIWHLINAAPSIDAVPVRRGWWEWRERWENHPETRSCDLVDCGWDCSECGIELGEYLSKKTGQNIILDDDYATPKLACCPNCGCDMREVEHETD